MRPATALMGCRSGRRRSAVSIVSYATPITLRFSISWPSSCAAARCRYVYTICPSRMRLYSGGKGSFTFMTMSARLHSSSGESMSVAPARSNSLSGIPDPMPAPACTST